MLNRELLIKYFIEKAKPLSLEYDEQKKIAIDLNLGDYFTEDIANDWFTEEISDLRELSKNKIVTEKAVELYAKIDSNFIEVSSNDKIYSKIWTLKGMKEHIFWQQQRELAKQFIKELGVNEDDCFTTFSKFPDDLLNKN